MKKLEILDSKVKLHYTFQKKNDENTFNFLIKTKKKSKIYYDENKEPVITDTVLSITVSSEEIEVIKDIMSDRKKALIFIGNENPLYKEIAQLKISNEIEIPYVES